MFGKLFLRKGNSIENKFSAEKIISELKQEFPDPDKIFDGKLRDLKFYLFDKRNSIDLKEKENREQARKIYEKEMEKFIFKIKKYLQKDEIQVSDTNEITLKKNDFIVSIQIHDTQNKKLGYKISLNL